MLVRLSANPVSEFRIIGELGGAATALGRIASNEFNYKKGTEIYGEKEPADYVYQVTSGAVRTYKLLSDGRRQIGAFHLVGDIFGLENRDTHRFTAEAVVDTTLQMVKRRSLENVAQSDVMVARNLLNLTTTNLQHAEDHMLLLGRKTALGALPPSCSRWTTGRRRNPRASVCRRIADYLGRRSKPFRVRCRTCTTEAFSASSAPTSADRLLDRQQLAASTCSIRSALNVLRLGATPAARPGSAGVAVG